MKTLRNLVAPGLLCFALAPAVASAANATWTVNYGDSNTAGGGGLTLTNQQSELTDEYKFTAESLILFDDVDASGNLSGGDTFDDYVAFRIDNLFLGGNNTFDTDYQLGNVDISGTVVASGFQVDALNYVVTSASMEFYIDGPGFTAGGTLADFANVDTTFTDGLLVQTGELISGAGVNGALVPDGTIDLTFALTDILSTLSCGQETLCDPFELFDPFLELQFVNFITDANNAQCPPTTCFSTVAGLEALFGVDSTTAGFFFQTRSDGSAVKRIPEPGSIALLGLGLLGLGLARRKAKA